MAQRSLHQFRAAGSLIIDEKTACKPARAGSFNSDLGVAD
jgi:hypothetical protein